MTLIPGQSVRIPSLTWRQALPAALLLGAAAGILVLSFPETVQLLMAVLVIFGVILSMLKLEWGLLVLVFITYTRFSDIAIAYHGAPSIAKSFILVLLAAVLLRWLLHRKEPTGWERAGLLICLFGVLILSSTFYAADPQRTRFAFISFAKNGVIVLIISILLHSNSTFRQLIWTLLAAGIFMGTITVIQYLTGTFQNNYGGFAQYDVMHIVGETSGQRVSGPLGDPNFYAQVMLTLIPLALDRLWSEGRFLPRFAAFWALTVCTLTVLFTFSRGAFIAMVVMFLLVLIFRPPSLSTVLLMLALLLLLVPFLPEEYTARMMTLTELSPNPQSGLPAEDSFRGRASELWSAWLMFKDHPLRGVGFNNFPLHYRDYSRKLGLAPQLQERAAHNLYLEIAAELGLIGLTVFGLILWQAGKAVRKTYRTFCQLGRQDDARRVMSFGLGVSGYLLAAFFIHDAYPRYLWLLLGICLALPNILPDSLRERERHV